MIVAIQEHAAAGKGAIIVAQGAKDKGWNLLLGPVNLELTGKWRSGLQTCQGHLRVAHQKQD